MAGLIGSGTDRESLLTTGSYSSTMRIVIPTDYFSFNHSWGTAGITNEPEATVTSMPGVYSTSQPAIYWQSLLLAAALSVIVLLTIGGNLLILAAVLFNSNLRGPTHILIANLAVADLLLGFLVLPFSATLEVTGNWYFGAIFCDVWAAVDVLCCTASIMSLCVISVDRYIGVTRPLNYYSIVTARRSTALCLIVWISSLSISIGPLLGWKERSDPSASNVNNVTWTTVAPMAAGSTASWSPVTDSSQEDDAMVCNVNTEKGYVLFSAIGSFYLPTLVILAVYWRIYRAAIKQTKFLESGTKTDKSTSSLSNEVLTLRVHVGRGTPAHQTSNNENHLQLVRGGGRTPRPSISVDPTQPMQIANKKRFSQRSAKKPSLTPPEAHSPPAPLIGIELDETNVSMGTSQQLTVPHLGNGHAQQRTLVTGFHSRKNSSVRSSASAVATAGGAASTGLSARVFKFRRQKKAAKTLGIVVGAFLLCWFPFFVILPVEALCHSCGIPKPLFSCCFWLGYCNSCLNPFIYASTSREFKRAFSKILCGRRARTSMAAAWASQPALTGGRNFVSNNPSPLHGRRRSTELCGI